MSENLIKKYVESLEKDDIVEFAVKENITISDYELNLIYNLVKTDIDNMLCGDFYQYLDKYKNSISGELYDVIVEKYEKYKTFIG